MNTKYDKIIEDKREDILLLLAVKKRLYQDIIFNQIIYKASYKLPTPSAKLLSYDLQ